MDNQIDLLNANDRDVSGIEAGLDELKGKTIEAHAVLDVELEDGSISNQLRFRTTDGCVYRFSHDQRCCEWVTIEDIIGDLDDLVGAPLLMCELVTSEDNPEGVTDDDLKDIRGTYVETQTWSFYKFATVKGYVTVRWYGASNGNYSETVDLHRLAPYTRGR